MSTLLHERLYQRIGFFLQKLSDGDIFSDLTSSLDTESHADRPRLDIESETYTLVCPVVQLPSSADTRFLIDGSPVSPQHLQHHDQILLTMYLDDSLQ